MDRVGKCEPGKKRTLFHDVRRRKWDYRNIG